MDEADAADAATWYADSDGDGYGDADQSQSACSQPKGYLEDDSDCDDTDAAINPGGEETCNDMDDDCDGSSDEDVCDGTEDCSDGIDNEGDGLTDCEDSDCVDACWEDCTNATDDDADGLVDCDDDECYGQSGCEGPYTVSLTTNISGALLLWGPQIAAWAGDYAGVQLYASVEVYGAPDGWSGTAFSCVGEVLGFSWAPSYGLYYAGAGGGVDYYFQWEPDSSGRSLSWRGPCLLDSLPSAVLGFHAYQDYISRLDDDGAWYTQYTAAAYYVRPYVGYTFNYMLGLTQTDVVSWEGYYYYP